jgi:hypothetical protein
MAGLRKPTISVPRVTRHASAWNPEALTFAPASATVRCGQGYYCEEHMVVIHESRDSDGPCEAI